MNRSFFFISLFLSRLADQVLLFIVPLVVFEVTGSVAWSGLAFTVETLPRFLAFPVCGVLCDRISALRLLRASQWMRAAACAGGLLAVWWGGGGVAWLVGLSAVCGVLTTQGVMAREVMLPQIFPGQRFEKVAAHSQIADQLGMVLGPLLASLMLGVWRWPAVVAGAALLFLAADLALMLWHRRSPVSLAPPEAAPAHWTAPVRTALRHVLHLPGLLKVIVLAAGVNLLLGITLATSAAMVTGLHRQSPSQYAALQTAGAVATVAILLFVARVPLTLKSLGLWSFGLMLGGTLLTGVARGPWLYFAGFLLVVGFDKMFSVYLRSLRHKIIPARDLGKTTGVIVMLNNLSQPLAGLLVGAFAAGAGGDARGVVLGVCAAVGLIGAAVAWTGIAALRRTAR